MKLRQRLKAALSIVAGTYRQPDEWMWEAFGARKTLAGVHVSETTAMNLAAAFACVSKISKTIASLPLPVYRKTANGKTRAEDHPAYTLLHDAPNPEMTAMVFRETLQAHALQWGNAYAEIERRGSGRPLALWPLRPDRTEPWRDGNGRLWYRLQRDDGGYTYLPPEDVLHIPGLGFDGMRGYSVIRMARESMGLSMAAEQFGAAFFGNGTAMGGVLEHPGNPTAEQIQNLRNQLNEAHEGPGRAHKAFIATGGMKYTATTIPPNDAQFLETRKFQVVEIARWFDVPPHKIASMDAATFGNIEHQAIEWVVDTIRPWCVRWEQEINRKLLATPDRSLFAKHVIEGLLRGDFKSRQEGYNIGRNGGWMSANDIRELEDMNRIDGGDVYLVPLNMQTAQQAEQTDKAEPSAAASALAERLARKEAKAVAKAYQQHRGAHAEFWDWFDKFMHRHAADAAAGLHLDAQAYTDAVRARIVDGIDDISQFDYETEARERLLSMRNTQ